MSYLQCPECRLTVRARAWLLRGDSCPRCMTLMLPEPNLRRAAAPARPLPVAPAVPPPRPAPPQISPR